MLLYFSQRTITCKLICSSKWLNEGSIYQRLCFRCHVNSFLRNKNFNPNLTHQRVAELDIGSRYGNSSHVHPTIGHYLPQGNLKSIMWCNDLLQPMLKPLDKPCSRLKNLIYRIKVEWLLWKKNENLKYRKA